MSRRFASILIFSSNAMGRRNEMVLVEGLRFGRLTFWAAFQSTYSLES